MFNLGETANNRLELTFNKIRSICSKYANLVQFFTGFFIVLKSLRSDRNYHYLMSLVRRSTIDSRLQHLEEDMRKDKRITNLEPIDHQTYRVNGGGHSLLHSTYMSMSVHETIGTCLPANISIA